MRSANPGRHCEGRKQPARLVHGILGGEGKGGEGHGDAGAGVPRGCRGMGTCSPLRGREVASGPWPEKAPHGEGQRGQRQAGRETLTSASRSSRCQSHTDSTWSLESSTAHRLLPPF